MEKLSTAKRLSIVKHYLSGTTSRENAAKNGVSVGTVTNVVNELKAGKFPEAASAIEHIEQLRELSLDLKRSKLSPAQCSVGLILLSRVRECGLDLADIDRWPTILKSVKTEEEIQEFIRLIYSIQEVQQRTSLSLEGLDDKVHELEKRAADLKPMSDKMKNYKKQIAELTSQRVQLSNAVAILEEKHKILGPRVRDLEKREKDLSRRIKDMEPEAEKAEVTMAALHKELEQLECIGLTLEGLVEFSQGVQAIAQRHNITPGVLRKRLLHELESLDQVLGLEVLMKSRQKELEKQEGALAEAIQEAEKTKAVVNGLKQEKAALEADIRETRGKVSREIAKISPLARDEIKKLKEELKLGHDEILADTHKLRNEAIEAGKVLGEYRGMLEVNEWLNELLALIRGEEDIEGKRVRAIALSVVRSIAVWLRHHEAFDFTMTNLAFTAENLVKEFEQWKV